MPCQLQLGKYMTCEQTVVNKHTHLPQDYGYSLPTTVAPQYPGIPHLLTVVPSRFNRGLKTLQQMQKSVKAGNAINEDDIPPPVLVRGVERSHRDEPQSQSSTPAAPSPSEDRSPSHKAGVPASIPQNLAFGEQNEPVPEPRANAKKEASELV